MWWIPGFSQGRMVWRWGQEQSCGKKEIITVADEEVREWGLQME